ncbi:cob(I)yrinic acid a,c-diamide adenosyltransferase [Oscillibacter sp.]|jgi:cob(I)alamin adenosyltransferase|uniref:cob(I)yrinic acid a,c-diamide adenosyltransferase n=1 Tax=Oscillibacter sp. TaxID=1945593 RepID=UPI0021702BF9|nr:cob(I)yrinic acid a,c-diamide adenosyltransferase [Oscillibacter sp.]MCI9648268.1 cob(I)yrinic acid a,c-diamide adenosyltransferase [Oscillibacter sp.]
MKIYTKTGDLGQTTLFGGTKVKKSSPRVCAYGTVDEANSFIGLAASCMPADPLADFLRICQRKLVVLSSELASDQRGRTKLPQTITPEDAEFLERAIDALSAGLAPSREFLVPGQTKESAYLHVARTQVRRAERAIAAVKDTEYVSPHIMIFMNRLSDLLFIMSRVVDEYHIFH